MAKDIYVEFVNADIIGDVRDKLHGSGGATAKNTKPTVEVTSFTHTIRQPKSATASTAGGAANERAEHGDLIFTKDLDAATPKLLQACSAGTIVKDVRVFFYRAISSQAGKAGTEGSTSQRKQYMKIEMKNVLVSSVTPSVAADGFPQETFTLRYSAIKWTYDEVRADGEVGHTGIIGAWNLANNTPSLA